MKLVWDESGKRLYETGVRQGVLYPQTTEGLYPKGVAWNGLSAITESPSGAEASPIYADDIKYLNLISVEEFGATIEAYTYPDEFAECDGSAELATGVYVGQQRRRAFGLSYRTALGNDIENEEYGYKLHLIYGATAAPSDKGYQTINDSPDAITFSWELNTVPVSVAGLRPTASITIDSTKVTPEQLAILENYLYGTEGTTARLPLPDEIAAIFAGAPPDALTLVSIAPDDEDVDVAVSASVVIEFNNKIVGETIAMADGSGGVVTGTKTWDVEGRTLTFKPTTNMQADTVYIVMIAGVTDIYGQALPVTVKNFLTA